MESLEESLINDKSIAEATVIVRQDHSGRVQFKTTLPSGRPLESEWIQESDKTKAWILWIEAVRGQIVQDSTEAALVARKTLKEQRAAVPSVKIVDSAGEALTSPSTAMRTPSTGSSAQSVASSVPVSADPAMYVRSQYLAAKSLSTFLSGEAARINTELRAAKATEAQWSGVLQAMGGSTGDEGHSYSVNGSAGTQSSGGILDVRVSSNQTDAAADDDDWGNQSVANNQ